jgi:transposase
MYMANKLLNMDITRLIIQCLDNKQSRRAIAKSTNVSRKAISKIESILASVPYTYRQALALEEGVFTKLFHACKPRKNKVHDSRYDTSVIHFKKYIDEKRKSVGLTLLLIHKEYLEQVASVDAYSYSQFCRHFQRYHKVLHTTMRIEHKPGSYLQLDFTGKHLSYTDIDSGEVIQCEVLVAVLPYSGMLWAVALPSTKQEDFIKGIQWVFRKITYLPKIIKIDNLKSGVIKSDKYEPKFNDLLVQFCNHYNVGLEATRPYKPKDKPSVEMSVNLTYIKAFAPLRNTVFTHINDLNIALSEQLSNFCKEDFKKKEFSRCILFEKEKEFLRPITCGKFELKKQTIATVQKDCTVMLGEDKHYYTVPYHYVGRRVDVIYTSTLVRVLYEGELIASHNREQGYYKATVTIEHYAPNNQAYLNKLKYTGTSYLQQATEYGPATISYIKMLLTNYAYEEMAYKSCEGLLRLYKNYGKPSVEQACKAFEGYNLLSYKPVQNYLANMVKGDTPSPSAPNTKTPSEHNNLRGAKHYS